MRRREIFATGAGKNVEKDDSMFHISNYLLYASPVPYDPPEALKIITITIPQPVLLRKALGILSPKSLGISGPHTEKGPTTSLLLGVRQFTTSPSA